MRLARKAMFSRLGFLAAGAAAAYLLDPDHGGARRAQLTNQVQGTVRRQVRSAAGEMRSQVNRAGSKDPEGDTAAHVSAGASSLH